MFAIWACERVVDAQMSWMGCIDTFWVMGATKMSSQSMNCHESGQRACGVSGFITLMPAS